MVVIIVLVILLLSVSLLLFTISGIYTIISLISFIYYRFFVSDKKLNEVFMFRVLKKRQEYKTFDAKFDQNINNILNN